MEPTEPEEPSRGGDGRCRPDDGARRGPTPGPGPRPGPRERVRGWFRVAAAAARAADEARVPS